MSNVPLPRTPLAKFLANCRPRASQTHPGVSLAERLFLGYLDLRTEPLPELIERIEREAGIRLPLEPNIFTEAHNMAIWQGPDEWLLVTPSGTQEALALKLRAIGQDRHLALADVTHGNTTLRVRGPKAIEMLTKGCSLDLHPSVFRAGSCAQTMLAKAQVTICRVNKSPAFDLIVRRSFSEYLARWIEDASLEYGLAISGSDEGSVPTRAE